MFWKNLIQYLTVFLSTTFVFFQASGIFRIDYVLYLLFILCIVQLVQKPNTILNFPIILYSIICVFMMVSLTYTVDENLTKSYLSIMFCCGLLYVCVGESEKSSQIVKRIIVGFSFFNVVITIYSFFFPETFSVVTNALLPNLNTRYQFISGILGQTGSNAYVITMVTLYLLVKLITFPQNEGKSVFKYVILLVFCLFALIITGKRGPLIWCITSAFFVNLFYEKSKNKIEPINFIFKYGVIFAVVFFVPQILENIDALKDALSRFSELSNIGDNERVRVGLYEKAVERINEHFIVGVGAGAYSHFGLNAHDDYLQIVAENGIVCSAFFFAFIGMNLIKSIKGFFITKDSLLLYFVGLQIFMMLNSISGTFFLHYGFYMIYIEVSSASASIIKNYCNPCRFIVNG